MDISVTNFTQILSCKLFLYTLCLGSSLASPVVKQNHQHIKSLCLFEFLAVDQRVGQILQFQQHSRARESRDFALLEDNQSYVSFWSVIQCVVVMATSSFQVYFVRKLFDTSSKGKARA